MKRIIFFLLIVATYQTTFAQNVGIGTTSPDASAKLDITSTTQGMLIPRMFHTQRNSIASPATGLIVYQTNTQPLTTNTPGFYLYDGTGWKRIARADETTWTVNGSNQYSNVAGNVGIGINTPTDKLHVAGNIKADTVKPNALKLTPDAGMSKILTSDATGNASWQSSSILSGNVGYGVWGDCAANGNISEYQPMADATGAANDNFGSSVSISGNYAIVGATGDNVGANSSQGSVSIYQWNGTTWVLMNKITDITGDAGDRFGSSVSISGNYAIVGAFRDAVGANTDQGSASIYQWNGTAWVLMQKITDATGDAGDNFGISVSISGNYAIVGAYGDDVGANSNQGSASIYQWNGTTWVLMQKITDATGAADDRFGSSVSISGNYAIVGATGDNVGANTDQGSATIYQRIGMGWQKLQYITDPGGNSGDEMGQSTSIDGITKRFLIGVPNYSSASGKVLFGKVN